MKKILLFSLAAVSLLASTYAKENADIFQNGKKIGEIIIGTKYERKGDEITLKAWRPSESKIAYDELGVLSASLILEPNASLKVLKTQEDDYETEWELITLKARLDKAIDSQKDPILDGEALFKERCGSCHALHSVDEFSKNVWPNTIKSMQDNAGLDENEYYQVVKFLQRHAPGDDD